MSDGVHRPPESLTNGATFTRFRLDFTFDDEAFELKSGEEDIGENVVVGGANRWAYNTFVNYETFPRARPSSCISRRRRRPSRSGASGPARWRTRRDHRERCGEGAGPSFRAICNA